MNRAARAAPADDLFRLGGWLRSDGAGQGQEESRFRLASSRVQVTRGSGHEESGLSAALQVLRMDSFRRGVRCMRPPRAAARAIRRVSFRDARPEGRPDPGRPFHFETALVRCAAASKARRHASGRSRSDFLPPPDRIAPEPRGHAVPGAKRTEAQGLYGAVARSRSQFRAPRISSRVTR